MHDPVFFTEKSAFRKESRCFYKVLIFQSFCFEFYPLIRAVAFIEKPSNRMFFSLFQKGPKNVPFLREKSEILTNYIS